jgi:hypothetical protein
MATDKQTQDKPQANELNPRLQEALKRADKAQKAMMRFGGLMWETTKSVLGSGGQRRVQRRSNRTVSGRYINDLITIAETTHIAGLHADLSQLLVEPRFLPEPELIDPVAEDDVRQEVFYVIPRMPDLPYIVAPYNLHNYRLEQLLQGKNRRLALLGIPGSGRTTALMAILLWVTQEISFDEPTDPVKQMLAEEDEALSEKEREEKARRRQEMREAAKLELEQAIESGEIDKSKAGPVNVAEAIAEDEAEGEPLPSVRSLLPMYFHCADLNITRGEFGSQVDPAEPLVRAVQRRLSTLSARTVPHLLYERLDQKRALVLIDGYDDLPAEDRPAVEAWLAGFLAEYGDNFVIMTGPAVGYTRLRVHDFTPLFVKPWGQHETNAYIDKWRTVWPQIDANSREVDTKQARRTQYGNHALYPAELTLKIWANFSGDTSKYHLYEWVETFINDSLPERYSYDNALPLLMTAGALQLESGFIKLKDIAGIQPENQAASKSAKTALEATEATAETASTTDTDTDEEDEVLTEQRQIVNEFVNSGLLVRFRGGRYRFRHPILADYLAGLTLTPLPDSSPMTLYQYAQDPAWQRALRFAARDTDLSKVIEMKLNANEDLLLSNLLEMALWLRATREETAWREDILIRLGNAFIQDEQYVINRERVTAALVESRDVKGAMEIFETGLTHPNDAIRRLSALGIGAIGQGAERYITQLSSMTVDPEEDVQLAAAHALAAIGTDEAKLALADAFLNGEERLQQAAAEAFANMPDGGYMTLYDATQHEQIHVRRAAYFGVRRIETEWASEVIRQGFLSEEEWYVRVIAQDAFIREQAGIIGPPRPATPDQLEWVQIWAREREIGLPPGERSIAVLMRTLRDDDLQFRALGAIVLGQIGVVEAIQQLYLMLKDTEPLIREAGHKGLVELLLRMGTPLPDPL